MEKLPENTMKFEEKTIEELMELTRELTRELTGQEEIDYNTMAKVLPTEELMKLTGQEEIDFWEGVEFSKESLRFTREHFSSLVDGLSALYDEKDIKSWEEILKRLRQYTENKTGNILIYYPPEE